MMEQGNGRMAGQRRPDPRKDRKMLGEKSEEEGLFTPVILVMQKGRRRRGGERRSWRSCFFFSQADRWNARKRSSGPEEE